MFGRFSSRFTFKSFKRRQLSDIRIGAQNVLSPKKSLLIIGGTALIGGCAGFYYFSSKASASVGYVEDSLHPPHFPWGHDKLWQSFDHTAIRRGFKVYNEIGSACHGMKHRYYRQLINVAFTEEEMKEIAAVHDDYDAEPNDDGEVLPRPGVLNDPFWNPYKNEKEARAANEGALPPDLSQIVRGREGGENYLFSLLTGYRDPPHGITLGENMYYNLYFPGCQLAMPPPLAANAIEYEDGTEASISQMAKDVSVFLAWSAFMEHDERHLMGLKTISLLTALIIPMVYWKKHKFTLVKKRHVEFLRRNKDD